MKRIFIFLGVFVLMPLSAFASNITVAGAANVQFTLAELGAEFTRETGIGITTVIVSSGKLTSQIENDAPFDVFMSADMKYPKKIYTDGFALQAPKIYAYGVLVLWTVKNLDLSYGIKVLSDPDVKKIALANPDVAPYGRGALKAMKFYKLYDSLKSELVLGESVTQTNQFITTGGADIGFTAESIVLAPNMRGKGKWVEVPAESYEPIAQGELVLKYGHDNHPSESEAFEQFLFSPAAQEIFRKYGYHLP